MTAGELVKFPTRRRVLERLGLDVPDRRTALDTEIRRIDALMVTLHRAKQAVLMRYWALMREEAPGAWRRRGGPGPGRERELEIFIHRMLIKYGGDLPDNDAAREELLDWLGRLRATRYTAA